MTRHRPLKPHAARSRRRYVVEVPSNMADDADHLQQINEDVTQWLKGRRRVLVLGGLKLRELLR